MAKKLFSDSPSCVSIDGFGGIDTAKTLSESECFTDILNFRVLSDHSVEKRCGYRGLASFDAPPRAVWSGIYRGKQICLAIVADRLYDLDPVSGEILRTLYLEGDEGDADFFFHDGLLYIMDGKEINIYYSADHTIARFAVYTPLLGRDWHPIDGGKVYEPINMLSDEVRIRFELGEESNFTEIKLQTSYKELIRVFIDGVASTSKVEFKNYDTLVSDSFVGAKTVEAVLGLYDSQMAHERIGKCRRALEFDRDGEGRVLLYGGEDETRVFCSAYVSDEMYEASRWATNHTGRLYFPKSEGMTIGGGRHRVRAVCPFSEKLLIFTEGGSFRAEAGSDVFGRLKTGLVNSSHGASAFGGVALCENAPFTIDSTGIFKWTEKSLNKNECDAENISLAVADLLPEDFFENGKISVYPTRRELWFICPGCDSAFVYSYESGRWVRFGGISADSLFLLGDSIGFVRSNEIFVFDESLSLDEGEHEISARLESKYFDFSTPEKLKKISSVSLVTEGGGEIEVSLTDERGHSHTYSLDSKESESPEFREVGVKKESFRFLKLALEAKGAKRQRIYSVALRTTIET